MDASGMHTDGNEIAGLLQDVFVPEFTPMEHTCLLLLLGSRPGRRRALCVLAQQPLDDGRVPGERRVLASEQLQPGEE